MILSGLTQKEVDERKVKEEQDRINQEARSELAATDWVVIREVEKYLIEIGKLKPEDSRDALREKVKE